MRQGFKNHRPSGLGKVNAKLIAAAPDLLAALRDLLQDTQHAEHKCGGGPEYCPVEKARAAIAKATGVVSPYRSS